MFNNSNELRSLEFISKRERFIVPKLKLVFQSIYMHYVFFFAHKIEQTEDESAESPSDKAPQGERTANIVI